MTIRNKKISWSIIIIVHILMLFASHPLLHAFFPVFAGFWIGYGIGEMRTLFENKN